MEVTTISASDCDGSDGRINLPVQYVVTCLEMRNKLSVQVAMMDLMVRINYQCE